jgi:hypothetical protein
VVRGVLRLQVFDISMADDRINVAPVSAPGSLVAVVPLRAP